mgnify:FL=1
MLKSNVSWSTDENSYNAGKECAKKAVVDLMETKVAFLFSSVKYNQEEMLEGAKSELGTAPIIGCTSSGGIIVPDGFITGENGFAGMLALGDPELTVGVAGSARGKNPRETGKKIALEAMHKAGKDTAPAYFYMVASPAEEEEYVKGIADVIGNVPFFGGSAADDTVEGKWSIFTNDTIFSDGVAVAFFYTNKPMANVYTGAYRETTNSGVITKISGKRTLVEIDGVPAMEKYAKWTGKKVKDMMGMNLLSATIPAPLGVKDRLGNLVAIRHPMVGNEDLSMNIGNNLAVNTAVIQMEATVDELIDSTGKALKEVNKELGTEAGAYLLVHCGGRKLGIGDRIDEVAKKLKKEAGNTPFLTVFTFGEYGTFDHSENTCGGLMLSFTGFGK